jgi:hypothetical protein|tara:strand:+ start:3306 stop:3566 length:261 start_codon:yes stop_codon:yes gene_type:complete
MDFLEDLELFNQAMDNAYLFITGKIDVEDVLVDLDNDDLEEFSLPFNPFLHEDISNQEIDSVIEHFSELEEYEKCAELVKCKEEHV